MNAKNDQVGMLDQTVVAGQDTDLDALIDDLKTNFSGKRAFRLDTEGAFHTYLMVEAAQQFREVLDATEFDELQCAAVKTISS